MSYTTVCPGASVAKFLLPSSVSLRMFTVPSFSDITISPFFLVRTLKDVPTACTLTPLHFTRNGCSLSLFTLKKPSPSSSTTLLSLSKRDGYLNLLQELSSTVELSGSVIFDNMPYMAEVSFHATSPSDDLINWSRDSAIIGNISTAAIFCHPLYICLYLLIFLIRPFTLSKASTLSKRDMYSNLSMYLSTASRFSINSRV